MGKKSSKQKTKSEPWGPGKAMILDAAKTIQGTVNANQGNLQGMSDQLRGYLPGLGEKAFGVNPMMEGARGFISDTLGGKYLNSNPYIDQMASRASSNARDGINSVFGKSGRTGSFSHADSLYEGMSDAELGVRYGAYNQERSNQMGAASMVPGMEAAQYAGVAPYLAANQTAAELPYAGLGHLSNIGAMFAPYGTQTTKSKQPWGPAMLGAGLGAANIFFGGGGG